MGRKPSMIAVANEEVSIVTACRIAGVELPEDIGEGRSRKVHCPFGQFYHSDQGSAPAMRIYPDTNSAWCFSCAAYFTPVKLMAQLWDVEELMAAERLLDRVGHRPLSLAQAWEQASEQSLEPDKALLADALKTYCRRTSRDWSRRQFEPDVAATLTRCLTLLDLVHTEADVELWLRKCKQCMTTALHTDEPSLNQKYDLLLKSMSERSPQ